MRWRALCLVLGAFLFVQARAGAVEGYRLFAIGAIQKGMGGAGVAAPKDATWLLLNPAALVDLDRRLDLSIEFIWFEETLAPRGNPLLANPFAGEMSDRNEGFIPSFGVVWPLRTGVLAFGAYATHGQKLAFDRPRSTLGWLGNGDRSVGFQVVEFPVAYAYEFRGGWSLGVAAVPAVIRLKTDSITLALRTARGDNEWDRALGFGFEVGLYRRWEQWGVGAAYSSRIWVDASDRYDADLSGRNLDIPQSLQCGVAYRPIPKVELVLDYRWVDSSGINLLSKKPLQSGLGWRDQHLVKGGVSWDVNVRWTLRTGVSWGTAPVRGDAVYINGLSPAVTKLHLGVGVSHRLSEGSAVHLSYARAFPEEATENGRGGLVSLLGQGTRIGVDEHSVTVQYSWKF